MIKYIIKTLQTILLINFWLMIGVGGILGYVFLPEVKIIGAIFGLISGFISATLFCGPILIIIEINDTISVMSKKNSEDTYKSFISKVSDNQVLTNSLLKDIYYLLSNSATDKKQSVVTTSAQPIPLKEIKL